LVTNRSVNPIRVQLLVREARRELIPLKARRFRRTVSADTSEVRDGVVAKLLEAMNETETLAKAASRRAKKGSGGVPAKARWYQLMAAISQTLDQVLRNVELDQIQAKMLELEKNIDELQRTTPKTG